MAFDETIAYRNDWQFVGRIREVSWERTVLEDPLLAEGLKARFGPISSPDLVSMAAGLGMTSSAAAVVVWQSKPDDVDIDDWAPTFDPKPGDILREALPETYSTHETGKAWLIRDITYRTNKANWVLLVDREVENA